MGALRYASVTMACCSPASGTCQTRKRCRQCPAQVPRQPHPLWRSPEGLGLERAQWLVCWPSGAPTSWTPTKLAREVVTPVRRVWPRSSLYLVKKSCKPDGHLDRAALARVVFGDADARAMLEAIIHPRVEQRARELFDVAPSGAMLVYDVPLLRRRVRTGLIETFAAIVVVDASDETRLSRLVARGLNPDDATRRMRRSYARTAVGDR